MSKGIKWFNFKKIKPPLNTLVLLYVPSRPWFADVKPDVHIVVGWRERGDDYFDEFGPDRYRFEEVEAWAYIDIDEEKIK